MGKVKAMYLNMEDLVYEAIENGATTESEVKTYLHTYHPSVNTDGSVLTKVFEDFMERYEDWKDEIENDGQPDEAQEWHDFDPDC